MERSTHCEAIVLLLYNIYSLFISSKVESCTHSDSIYLGIHVITRTIESFCCSLAKIFTKWSKFPAVHGCWQCRYSKVTKLWIEYLRVSTSCLGKFSARETPPTQLRVCWALHSNACNVWTRFTAWLAIFAEGWPGFPNGLTDFKMGQQLGIGS